MSYTQLIICINDLISHSDFVGYKLKYNIRVIISGIERQGCVHAGAGRPPRPVPCGPPHRRDQPQEAARQREYLQLW